ncbi:hypothetical protein SAMN04244573_03219 [Azotobacter beijerinckii]|uniref:Uncharacterized protein n=1 Tax=Azotobacter beijerinckii TaxID=170623 RepID=A0A1H9MPS4_9GAMM|nr:hypothetical protein [Azotobacter beijerinckii]SER25638.1 hypothetical protein SAMN04244573_03219 [Azotobacter beijerinckii]
MTDYYLRAPDADTLQSALIEVGAAQLVDGALVPLEGEDAIDIIGVWYERTGGTDEDPVYTAVPGYHGNVRSVAPITWPETVEAMEPTTPWRVWG